MSVSNTIFPGPQVPPRFRREAFAELPSKEGGREGEMEGWQEPPRTYTC
jgi:hypothetical protein